MTFMLRQTRMFVLLLLGVWCSTAAGQEARAPQQPSTIPEASPSAGLDGVRTIYVIPMKDRLEHFLTNELVNWGRFEVTLNPRQADALLSDTTDVDIKQLMAPETKIRKTTARTRGTAFLIDLKTERVIWSVAKKPSESMWMGGTKSVRELAEEMMGQLKKDLQPKAQ
jgi:hypothetical protein